MLEQNTQTDETKKEHHEVPEGSRRERRRSKQNNTGKGISWPIRIIGSIVLIFISLIAGLAIGYA